MKKFFLMYLRSYIIARLSIAINRTNLSMTTKQEVVKLIEDELS